MEINKQLIEKVAKLARLNLKEEEKNMFIDDFKEILDVFSKIDKINTDNVKASFQPMKMKNIFRDDLIRESVSQETALANTINKKDGFFKGPNAM